jgi:hypothetical protein
MYVIYVHTELHTPNWSFSLFNNVRLTSKTNLGRSPCYSTLSKMKPWEITNSSQISYATGIHHPMFIGADGASASKIGVNVRYSLLPVANGINSC